MTASALLGLFFAPSIAGKSLDEIQRERGGDPHADGTPRFSRAGADAAASRERIASGD